MIITTVSELTIEGKLSLGSQVAYRNDPCGKIAVDLQDLPLQLCRRGIRSLMVEGGSRLFHSFFREDFVDRIVIKHIPVLSGDPSAPSYLAGSRMAVSEWQVETWHCIGGVGVATYVRKQDAARSVAA
jgi:riboflavin biosynthesis pyrimidine reductase